MTSTKQGRQVYDNDINFPSNTNPQHHHQQQQLFNFNLIPIYYNSNYMHEQIQQLYALTNQYNNNIDRDKDIISSHVVEKEKSLHQIMNQLDIKDND